VYLNLENCLYSFRSFNNRKTVTFMHFSWMDDQFSGGAESEGEISFSFVYVYDGTFFRSMLGTIVPFVFLCLSRSRYLALVVLFFCLLDNILCSTFF